MDNTRLTIACEADEFGGYIELRTVIERRGKNEDKSLLNYYNRLLDRGTYWVNGERMRSTPRQRLGDNGNKYRIVNGKIAYSWLCMSRINNSGDCMSHVNLNGEKTETIIWDFEWR